MDRNDAGKSTQLKVIAGEVKVERAGTIYDVVAEGLGDVGHLIATYHHLVAGGAEDLNELSRVQSASTQETVVMPAQKLARWPIH